MRVRSCERVRACGGERHAEVRGDRTSEANLIVEYLHDRGVDGIQQSVADGTGCLQCLAAPCLCGRASEHDDARESPCAVRQTAWPDANLSERLCVVAWRRARAPFARAWCQVWLPGCETSWCVAVASVAQVFQFQHCGGRRAHASLEQFLRMRVHDWIGPLPRASCLPYV